MNRRWEIDDIDLEEDQRRMDVFWVCQKRLTEAQKEVWRAKHVL